MGVLAKGKTFGTTEIVTAAKLHQLVDGGSVSSIVTDDFAVGHRPIRIATSAPAGQVVGDLWSNTAGAPILNIYNGADNVKVPSVPVLAADVDEGFVVQRSYSETAAATTTTTVIPYDDTIPQNTEGAEFLTISHTPKTTTNRLIIFCQLYGSNNNGGAAGEPIIAALFQDAIAGALAAQASVAGANTGEASVSFVHEMQAGTTSVITFKLRAGPGVAGTFQLNGQQGVGRKLGGVKKTSITILEVKRNS